MKRSCENILILTDLDGTFFGKGFEIPKANRDAVAAFVAAGGRFTLATGRSCPTVYEMIPDIESLVNAPMITGNGTVIYDTKTKQVLSEKSFASSPAFWNQVRALAERYPISYRVHTKEMVSQNYDRTDRLPSDPPRCEKLVFCHEQERSQPVFELLCAELRAFAPGLQYSRSCPVLLEALPPCASKGEAVEDLRRIFAEQGNVPKIYGVGDYENDLTMLCACDVAACPENAQACVKAVCQYQLCHHTEGAIADLIRQIFAEIGQ